VDRLLLRRGGTLLLSNTLGQGLGFLTAIAIARLLGVSAFGQYTAIMALVFVCGIVADAGLEVTLTREAAATPARSRALLAGGLQAKALAGGPIALLLAWPPVATFLAPAPAAIPAIQLAGLLVLLNTWNAALAALFRAWGRMDYILGLNSAGLGVQLAGTVALLIQRPNLVLLVGWLILVQVGELAAGLILFRRGLRGLAPATSPGPAGAALDTGARALLRRSWSFMLIGLLGALAGRVDLFLIAGLAGPAAVGVYSVATRLHELLGLAPNSFFAALLPALAAAQAVDAAAAAALYRQARRRLALAGGIAAAGGLGLAGLLVQLSFGPAYAAAVPALQLLALLLIPLLINRTTTLYLYATGRERHANYVLALNLLLRAILGGPLVLIWGPPGAALANLVAEGAVLGVYWASGAMRGAA